MKKIFRYCSLILALVLMMSLFTACGDKEENKDNSVQTNVKNDNNSTSTDSSANNTDTSTSTPEAEPAKEIVYYSISFEANGGSAVAAISVAENETGSSPSEPAKDGFYFGGWYSDEALTSVYDFTAPVTSDLKLFAAWVDASGSITANFYSDDKVTASVHFTDGGRISKPENPVKDGYYFAGWFTADGSQYKPTIKYSGSQNFYAKWLKIYTFEAEKTQLTGLDPDEDETCSDIGNKLGQSYSGNVSGANLIGSLSCDASNGSYVTNLYYNGAFLQFEIESDADTDEALLFLRLSGEFTTISLTKDTFTVTVNGTKINYEPITIKGGTTDDLTSTSRTPMMDYAFGNISLKAGMNIIKLEVTNNDKQFATGTMDAAAPIIDAVKVYSQTGLSMTEYKN